MTTTDRAIHTYRRAYAEGEEGPDLRWLGVIFATIAVLAAFLELGMLAV